MALTHALIKTAGVFPIHDFGIHLIGEPRGSRSPSYMRWKRQVSICLRRITADVGGIVSRSKFQLQSLVSTAARVGRYHRAAARQCRFGLVYAIIEMPRRRLIWYA